MRRGGGPAHAAHPPIATTTAAAGGPTPFPQCATDVLQKMVKGVRMGAGSGKYRTQAQYPEWQQQIDGELFCLTSDQFHISKLTPVQRLQLLEVIAKFFKEKEEDPLRYTYFEVIFLGHEGEPVYNDARMDLLYNLASFSLQFPVLAIFTTISQWLSKTTTPRSYAEKMIALLVDHYIKPDVSHKMYEFLLPLDFKCPEFISLFLTLAHRTAPMSESLAIVYGTFMQTILNYMLSQFRDETWMAEEFAKEVFPKCLSYVLSIDPSKVVDLQEKQNKTNAMYSLCSGLLPIMQGWSKKVKEIELDTGEIQERIVNEVQKYELDAEPLFDNSYPWTTHRCDLLIIYGKFNNDNFNKVHKFLEHCYPPHWVSLEVQNHLSSCIPIESMEISEFNEYI